MKKKRVDVGQQELASNIVALVDGIMLWFTDPANWPLTDKERVFFLKETYARVRKIVATEEYALLKLRIAASRMERKPKP